MAKRFQAPNVNRILDPSWAKAETERIFGQQLEAARDVCDWGSNLYMRIFDNHEPKDVGSLVILMLFRQVLAMLDATVIHLENGAVYAGQAPLRSMLEASWSLEWLLEKGTDFDRRCWYVAFMRAQRAWHRTMIKGTREYWAFRKTGQRAAGVQDEMTPADDKQNRADLREINRILRQK